MFLSRGAVVAAVAATFLATAVACGGDDASTPATSTPVASRTASAAPTDVASSPAPAESTPPTAAGTPDTSASPSPGTTPIATPTPAGVTPLPAATTTPVPAASDVTIAIGADCAFSPNPATVAQGGVVRFANGGGVLVEVAVFFANDAGFDGAEIEPGEVSPLIAAAHAGRAELTCEGPELQFARGVLNVVPSTP